MNKIYIEISNLVHSKDIYSNNASGFARMIGYGCTDKAEILALNLSEKTIMYKYTFTYPNGPEDEIFIASLIGWDGNEYNLTNGTIEINVLMKYTRPAVC